EFLVGLRSEYGSVLALEYSPDCDRLVAATIDHGIHAINTTTWESKVVARTQDQPQVVAHAAHGELVGLTTSPIELFRTTDFRRVQVIKGHELGGDQLKFSPDGTYLVSGNADAFVRVWNLPSGKLRWERKFDSWIQDVDVHQPTGQIVVATSRKEGEQWTCQVRFHRAETGEIVRTIDSPLPPMDGAEAGARCSPDGQFLLFAYGGASAVSNVPSNGSLQEPEWIHQQFYGLWDLNDNRCVAAKAVEHHPYGFAFSPDSLRFALVDTNGGMEVWTVEAFAATQMAERDPRPHNDSVARQRGKR
ncbi:MAG: hypothetical protein KDA61_23315, partial [Planctomycetales bacterium]|nr:hypothetical protein [Planctomycetales bacterium]